MSHNCAVKHEKGGCLVLLVMILLKKGDYIMTTKDWLSVAKELYGLGIVKFLFIGSNKTDENQMGHQAGERIHINKTLHLVERQREFIIRAYITNILLCLLGFFLYKKITVFQVEKQSLGWLICIIWVVVLLFMDRQFSQYLIGYGKNNFALMQQVKRPIRIFHLLWLVTALISLWTDIFGVALILVMSLILAGWLYIDRKFVSTLKQDIYSFVGGDNTYSGDYIDLKKDIKILETKNGAVLPRTIDLTIGDIYICDNDNVKVTQGKRMLDFDKEKIAAIEIKGERVIYDTETGKWMLASQTKEATNQ